MPVSGDSIKVYGLREFQRGLRQMDRSLPKGLRVAMNDAANVVVRDAQPRVPHRTGRAAASIRASSTQSAVRVSEGSARAKYMPWLDFGGRVGRKRSVVRPFYKEGRYLYKSYFAKRDSGEFREIMIRALAGLAREAGIKMDTSP
jgi:hypothetical protein